MEGLMLGLIEGLTEIEGLTLGLMLGLTLGDSEGLTEGDTDGLSDPPAGGKICSAGNPLNQYFTVPLSLAAISTPSAGNPLYQCFISIFMLLLP